MRVLKTSGIVVLVVLVAVAGLLLFLAMSHTKQLRKEALLHPPPGQMVTVGGKQIHVYTDGAGDATLVFLAGHGTSNPTLDFKPLWTKLVDGHRIVVVERSGYGWSEPSRSPRDIATILEETRTALELSGEKGPYVLFAHSMAGLEALYWAQQYPHEIEAIIGLDPCTPDAVALLPEPSMATLYAMALVSRTGLARYMPDADIEMNLPLMASDDLTEKEKRDYLAVFYKSAYSRDMIREAARLRDNAQTVAEGTAPEAIPMYFFASDGQEAVVTGWQDALAEYLAPFASAEYMQLNTGHYVHYEKADVIAQEARLFLKDVR